VSVLISENLFGSISDIAIINPETTNSGWNGREIIYIDIGSVGCRTFSIKPESMMYDDAPSRARRVVQHGDILISTIRPNRRSMIQILNPPKYAVASTGFALLRPKRLEDSDYLLAIISNPQFTLELEMLAYGAAYPAVSVNDICRISAYIPASEIRDNISNILRPMHQVFLKDFSEVSYDTISTIFKSWFIDFDPVKAKEKGLFPFGMDEKTAALFPSSFEYTELGPIPNGWKWGSLGDMATLSKKTINPQKTPKKRYHYYSIPAFDAGGIPILTSGDDIKSNKYLIEDNCVLLSKLNPRFNRVWMINDLNEGPSIASTEFLPWVPKDGFSTSFLYGLMRSYSFRWLMEGRVTGTTGSHQRVRPNDCASIPCVIPPIEVIEKFNNATEAIFWHINYSTNLKEEITKLYNILAPKLISGQLKVN
jgi:type I restriction enzyme, S subunit